MTLSRKLAKLIVEQGVSVEDVVTTLTTYNLLGLLPAVLDRVVEISSHKKANGVIAIEAPFTLSDEAIAHIKKITGNSDVEHEVTINKNILAGFKARFRGTLYDGSAERIIKQLTKQG
jgi:F0F1-type ATP synthase delta subunit